MKVSLSIFLLSLFAAHIHAATENTPNFIIILSDDQGWNNTSVQMDKNDPRSKSDYFQTPSLERLAASGMRFSRGYAPACECSPTRYSILFGKTAARMNHTRVRANLERINIDQPTLPLLLKEVNPRYATAHFGKWHIDADPSALGYDESDGITRNNHGNYFIETKNKWGGIPHEDPKKIFQVTQRAIDFISRQVEAEKPFLIQISHYANHGIIMAKKETADKYAALPKGIHHQHPYYAAMNENLDTGIGMVLDQIQALGIDNNTYIVYLADNGGVPQMPPFGNNDYDISQNYPLTRGKWALLEGGARVPFFIAGPGIEPNSQSDEPVIAYDLLPTFLELAGRTEPLPKSFDGGSLAPILFNRGAVLRGTDELIFHYPHYNKWGVDEPHSAIIDKDYKLVKMLVSGKTYLFNVATDCSEQFDISSQYPEIAASLEQRLDAYLKDVNAETKEESPTWKKNANKTSALFPRKSH